MGGNREFWYEEVQVHAPESRNGAYVMVRCKYFQVPEFIEPGHQNSLDQPVRFKLSLLLGADF
jgi:hypothetical protein